MATRWWRWHPSLRSSAHRARDGNLPGAVVIGRNPLERRLDPVSPTRIAAMTGYHQPIILIACTAGCSSLAAATRPRPRPTQGARWVANRRLPSVAG
jgi:hypothetical protein